MRTARGLFAREAFGTEGEDHVVGVEGRAVMEDDALTKLEFHRFGGDALPGFRKTGGESARLLVGVHERFVDRINDAVRGIGIEALRFDRGGKLRHGITMRSAEAKAQAPQAARSVAATIFFICMRVLRDRWLRRRSHNALVRMSVFALPPIISNGFDNPVTTS